MFDYIATFAKIISTQVKGAKKAILAAIQGSGSGLEGDVGESSAEETTYGQVGILARPLPENSGGATEAVCLRIADGLIPIACRDLRLSNAIPEMESGQFSMAHYGGGFITVKGLDSTNAQTLIQLKTGPALITLDPTATGTVSIGDSNTAQSVPFSPALFDWVALVQRILTTPSVNGSPPSATLTPTELITFNAYGSSSDETEMLKAN